MSATVTDFGTGGTFSPNGPRSVSVTLGSTGSALVELPGRRTAAAWIPNALQDKRIFGEFNSDDMPAPTAATGVMNTITSTGGGVSTDPQLPPLDVFPNAGDPLFGSLPVGGIVLTGNDLTTTEKYATQADGTTPLVSSHSHLLADNTFTAVGVRGIYESGSFLPYETTWTMKTSNAALHGDSTRGVDAIYLYGEAGLTLLVTWGEVDA